MAQVELQGVFKCYGSVVAVDDLSLTVADGEFVALVGPSGCGKTTSLNLIAGLIELTEGDILIGERNVTRLDPKDRDIAMVFQNYALYPNKSVFHNLAFPLRMRRLDKKEIDEKVNAAAKLLDIEHLLKRRPRELSGGQQQRVALGRALVRDPQVFLMDEPLSNLDAKLRVQMRAELKRFHQDLNATVVYVTHDQLEAMTMADQMAVMSGGILQQYDTPERIFENPVNTFVAGFVGSPAMNLLNVELGGEADRTVLQGNGWRYTLNEKNSQRASRASTSSAVLGLRHSTMILHTEAHDLAVGGKVYTVEPTGDITFVHVNLGDSVVVVSTPPEMRLSANQPIWIELDQNRIHLFDGVTQQSLAED